MHIGNDGGKFNILEDFEPCTVDQSSGFRVSLDSEWAATVAGYANDIRRVGKIMYVHRMVVRLSRKSLRNHSGKVFEIPQSPVHIGNANWRFVATVNDLSRIDVPTSVTHDPFCA